MKGAIFNDLERPLPPISRSRHSLTLNISETVRDTDIVSMEYLHTPYSIMSFPITLSDLEWLSKKLFSDTKHRAVSLRQQSYFLTRSILQRVRWSIAAANSNLLLILVHQNWQKSSRKFLATFSTLCYWDRSSICLSVCLSVCNELEL